MHASPRCLALKQIFRRCGPSNGGECGIAVKKSRSARKWARHNDGKSALIAAMLVISLPAIAQNTPVYPSETPAHFQPATGGFDYQRHDVMIPMRDGVKLHTVILVPNGGEECADPVHPHALQRHRAHFARAKFTSRSHPSGV